MDIKIDINPEQINQAVVDAIIGSSIGVQIKDIVEKKVQELGNNFNNPIQKVVDQEIRNIIYKLLQSEYQEKMKDMVRQKMTDDTLNSVISKAFEAAYSID